MRLSATRSCAEDPGRVRLVQSDQSTQIIAAQAQGIDPEMLRQQITEEADTIPMWLTARQVTLLSYLLCQQQRQLETDGDPEPLAIALQSDGRPIAERAGFLTMQLLQLLAAVALTHYRLVFIANQATPPEQQQQLVTAWRQHLPTAVIYQVAFEGSNNCMVWHVYLPANQGKPTEDQIVKSITVAQVIANVDFDHQDHVYGTAYWEFVSQTRATPAP